MAEGSVNCPVGGCWKLEPEVELEVELEAELEVELDVKLEKY